MKQIGTIGIVFAVMLMLSGIASANNETNVTTNVSVIPILASIVVTPNPAIVLFEETEQFIAEGFDDYGNSSNTTPTWTTTDIGEIDAVSGLFTARHAPGTGTVTATDGNISNTSAVTIETVKSISVDVTNIDFGSIGIGQTSAPQSVTVINTGNVAATVTAAPTDLTSGTDTIAAINVGQSGFGALDDPGTVLGSFTLTIPAGTPLGTYTGTIDITAS